MSDGFDKLIDQEPPITEQAPTTEVVAQEESAGGEAQVTPPVSTVQADDDNIFSQYEEADQPTEETPWKRVAQKLGFEETPNEEEAFANLLKARLDQAQAPKFQSPDIEEFVQTANTLAKSGEDWRIVRDNRARIQEFEAKISQSEQFDKSLERVAQSEAIETHREFLAKLYDSTYPAKNAAILKAALEDRPDWEIIQESVAAIAQQREMLRRENEGFKSSIEQIRNSEQELIRTTQEREQAAKAAIAAAIDKYEDPDKVKTFTAQARQAARKAFNSDPVSVTLPKGVAELFLMQDGKFSPEKVIDLIAQATTGPQKRAFLEKLAKQSAFKKVQQYQPDAPKGAGDARPTEADEWGGGVTM